MFKNRKTISIILCIGIITSSFSGFITTYAKNENMKEQDILTLKAPEQNITESLPEVVDQEPDESKNEILTTNEGYILYQGTRTRYDSEGSESITYSLSKEEIVSLMESGYRMQDIFEVDDISNEIYIDPMELFQLKEGTDKSWKELKDDVLKQRKDDCITYLKSKYKKEISTLENEGMNKDEIIQFLMNADAEGLKINDGLIKEYQSKGTDTFKHEKNKGLSDNTKKKYSISDKDAAKLTEEQIIMIEKVAKNTDKPVKELIKSFIKSIKN